MQPWLLKGAVKRLHR